MAVALSKTIIASCVAYILIYSALIEASDVFNVTDTAKKTVAQTVPGGGQGDDAKVATAVPPNKTTPRACKRGDPTIVCTPIVDYAFDGDDGDDDDDVAAPANAVADVGEDVHGGGEADDRLVVWGH